MRILQFTQGMPYRACSETFRVPLAEGLAEGDPPEAEPDDPPRPDGTAVTAEPSSTST
jgi:hypothetical protein